MIKSSINTSAFGLQQILVSFYLIFVRVVNDRYRKKTPRIVLVSQLKSTSKKSTIKLMYSSTYVNSMTNKKRKKNGVYALMLLKNNLL